MTFNDDGDDKDEWYYDPGFLIKINSRMLQTVHSTSPQSSIFSRMGTWKYIKIINHCNNRSKLSNKTKLNLNLDTIFGTYISYYP